MWELILGSYLDAIAYFQLRYLKIGETLLFPMAGSLTIDIGLLCRQNVRTKQAFQPNGGGQILHWQLGDMI
jgi:hypothetical protein